MNPVPFKEAIEWAKARKVVLPDTYYGELQGLARSMSFSIAGMTQLDQLQSVLDDLNESIEKGESFAKWKKRAAKDLGDLPDHRIETIFRTNIQGAYGRGRCEQQARTVDAQPYLMYDAVNDSRTRPSHAAMDGFVARHDDPIWSEWRPPAGYNCRCRVIALSEEQAGQFITADERKQQDPENSAARQTARPDKGWDYDPCAEPDEGLRRAWEEKVGTAHPALAEEARKKVAASIPIDPSLIRKEIGKYYEEYMEQGSKLQARKDLAKQLGVPEEQIAALAHYTEIGFETMNRALRGSMPMTEAMDHTIRAAANVMDKIGDPYTSTVYRGIKATRFESSEFARSFEQAHTKPGSKVRWSAFTSTSKDEQIAKRFERGYMIQIENVRGSDISSIAEMGEKEVLLPPGQVFEVKSAERITDGSDSYWKVIMRATDDSAGAVEFAL